MLRVVLVVALPLVAIALLGTLDGVRRERARFNEQMVQTARAVAIALDGDIARVEYALRMLAGTPEGGRLPAGRGLRQAIQAAVDGPALALVLNGEGQAVAEADGWPDRPPGPVTLDQELRAAARATPGTLISNLVALPGGGFAVAAVQAMPAAEPPGLLALLVPSTRFGQVLRAQNLPEGWVAAVVDREGRVAARTRSEAEFLGAVAMPRTRAVLAEAGAGVVTNITTHDGMFSTTAAARAPRSGYAVVIAAPAPGTWQDLKGVLGLPALAGAGLVIAAIWSARRISMRVLAGIAALAPGAPAIASGVRELDDAAARLRAAEAARATAMQRLEQSEARYRIATEAFAGGIYECRPLENAVIRSPGHLAILGEERDDPVREWWLDRLHPEDRPRLEAAIAGLQSGERDRFELEYRVRHRLGHHIWVWHRSVASRDAGGQVSRFVGSVTDISAERSARDNEALVAREMEHRVKNSFALISSLVSLTAARWPEAQDFAAELRERVTALTAAHDLVHRGAEGTTLHGLIRRMTAPYALKLATERVSLEGDDMALRPAVVPQFGLVLHEWLTNAAKYGALSTPEGRLRIVTRRSGQDLRLDWEEEGGPDIAAPPEEMGFGSMLLASTAHSLGAHPELDWRPQGLRITLTLPLDRLTDPEGVTPVRA
jgi:PAS domain S-box-containing protein